MKARILALLLALVMVASLFAACSAGKTDASGASTGASQTTDDSKTTEDTKPVKTEKTKIVYWHAYTDQHEEKFLELAAAFNASQDEYELVAEQQPYSEIDSKTMQAVRNGTGPDLVNMYPSDAVNYLNEGRLVDLSVYINDPEIGIPNFKDNVPAGQYSEITQWGDGIYVFPCTTAGEVLFYNKTMFDKYGLEAPKTWTELAECSKIIHEKEGIPGFGTDSLVDTYQCLIMQAGSGYIDEDGNYAIDETIAKGGNVVIPSFAVGRTQELLYFIREIKDKGMVKSDPDFPVYIDSPLAKKATTIFTGDLRGYLDEAALELVQDGTHMFNFTNLRMTETSEESKMLNMDPTPKVIISASGMCDAGRIRHHLKHNLWRPECTVVFVGYQGEGTLGRALLEGVKSVKLFGEEIAVHAQIVNFQGLSSHADRNHLLSWIQAIQAPKPQHVFVVHGDREVAPFFAKTIQGLGFTAHAPQYTEVYDLIADKVTEPGYLPERKARTTGGMRASAAYERLVAVGNMLMESIKRSRGRDNKSLARFADQLRQLLEKWES